MDVKKLSELTKEWKTTVPIAGGYVNIPDGDYVGDLKEMKMEEAKASGRLQICSSFEIVASDDPDQEGKTIKSFDGLDNKTSRGYFKDKCNIIGLDLPEDAKDWQDTLDAFVANPDRVDLYNITIKTSKGKNEKDYSNVFVNGISEYTKGVEGETVEGEIVDEGQALTQEEQDELDQQQKEQEEAQAEDEARALALEKEALAQQLKHPRKVMARPVSQVAKPLAKVAAPIARATAKPVAPPVVMRKIIARK